MHFIKVGDIIYLEASISYTFIYTLPKNKFIVSRTLKDFEDILSTDLFIRIHNSYIINKNFAKKYIRREGGQVVLSNGTTLDVAKRKKKEFLKAIRH